MQATILSTTGELARDLTALTSYIFKESSADYYALVDELDLSISQLRMLALLERCDGEVSVKELAERIRLSLPATSRNVEGLLQRGYLERREDEHDRRVRRVRITAQGRNAAERLAGARLAAMETFVQSMTERQRERLRTALGFVLEREDISACRPAAGAGR